MAVTITKPQVAALFPAELPRLSDRQNEYYAIAVKLRRKYKGWPAVREDDMYEQLQHDVDVILDAYGRCDHMLIGLLCETYLDIEREMNSNKNSAAAQR